MRGCAVLAWLSGAALDWKHDWKTCLEAVLGYADEYAGLADKSKCNFITLYIYFCGIWPVLGCIDADLCK